MTAASPIAAIVDYGSGNLRSAAKALERAAAEAGTGHCITVTDDPGVIAAAERIVLPGVGAFADFMRGLEAVPGLRAALDRRVMLERVPFLGICVGMQLMADEGHEHGTHRGLGWIGGAVVRLAPSDPALKIPHMGWNALRFERSHPVTAGLGDGAFAYFVHSYRFSLGDPADGVASAAYGGPVTAIIARDNLIGTQFHPEKSQATGLALLGGFLRWQP